MSQEQESSDDDFSALWTPSALKYIPDSTKVIIPGAGHMANMDKPLAVMFEILKFLLIVIRGHTGVEQLMLEP